MIASAIQQAQWRTAKTSATILAADREATAHVRTAGHTRIAAEALLQGCIFKGVEEGGVADSG